VSTGRPEHTDRRRGRGNARPNDPTPGSYEPVPTGIPADTDPEALTTAIVQAVLVGVSAAAQAPTGTRALGALEGQAHAPRL
jgi:hypothetical protein